MEWSEWVKERTDPARAYEKSEALDDVTVLDLSYGSFAGLFASSLLAEFGAKVIRIEPPEGDIAREMTPFGLKVKDTGLAYIVEGRNKFHITLDITKEEGREILKKLVKKADVLIETYPPGYADELGIGWKDLREVNPQLIYVSIHSYGQKGELAEKAKKARWKDYDIISQALSGFAYNVGIPEDYEEFPEHTRVPTKTGNWMAWYAGGAYAALAIMAALMFRKVSGEGQFIDISPAEALMTLNNYALHFYHLTGEIINRTANFEPAAFPYNYVRCKDGMVFIAGYTDPNWKALCSIIGREDLVDKYPSVRDRTDPKNWIPITREIEKFTMQHTREELLQMWLSYKGPGVTVCGEILKPSETIEHEHWFLRRALIRFRDRDYGELLVQGVAVKMTESPPRIKWICRPIGADNEKIYYEMLGLSRKDLEELKKKGII